MLKASVLFFGMVHCLSLIATGHQDSYYQWSFDKPPPNVTEYACSEPVLYMLQNKNKLFTYKLPSLCFIGKRAALMDPSEVFLNTNQTVATLGARQPLLCTPHKNYVAHRAFCSFTYLKTPKGRKSIAHCWELAIQTAQHACATPRLFFCLCFKKKIPRALRKQGGQTLLSPTHIKHFVANVYTFFEYQIKQDTQHFRPQRALRPRAAKNKENTPKERRKSAKKTSRQKKRHVLNQTNTLQINEVTSTTAPNAMPPSPESSTHALGDQKALDIDAEMVLALHVPKHLCHIPHLKALRERYEALVQQAKSLNP
ncbi:MAG: hypothetical protein ACPG7U_05250 [Holosporaceae bacterium]